MTPEKMIELLLLHESEGESFSGALYGAFWRGFPLENLRRLLLADNDNAIATGARLRPGTVFETVIAARMLSHENRAFNKAMLEELVSHADPIVRRFAAGMAARPRTIGVRGHGSGLSPELPTSPFLRLDAISLGAPFACAHAFLPMGFAGVLTVVHLRRMFHLGAAALCAILLDSRTSSLLGESCTDCQKYHAR